MRKKDYPKSDSNGVRRATKEAVLKVLESNPRNKTTLTALIMAFKDSGLRVRDMRLLKCNLILEYPNADIIPITIITEKTNLLAKTFFGEEAITALKAYIEHRTTGSKAMEPETITNESEYNMNKLTSAVLVIVLAVVFSAIIYQQVEIENLKRQSITSSPQPTTSTPYPTVSPTSSPTPNPTPTPTSKTYTTPPSSPVAADLIIIPYGSAATAEDYLLISGNVTNKTPNTLYNFGLHVYSFGYPFMAQPIEVTLINVTVPIASGPYSNGQHMMSTLAPHESIQITIKIIPDLAYRTPTLYGNDVSVVWTNSP
jgi:hypothetical protein